MLAYAALFELRISWLGKHKLFTPPFGWIMRAMGGVPVVRHKNQNTVSAMADAFTDHENLIVVIPAEGTRRRVEYWKSGFYQIALKAGVPIVPSYLDYSKKQGGFGPALIPTGDIQQDMQYLRDFYAPMKGKFADMFGPVRLREETDPPGGV